MNRGMVQLYKPSAWKYFTLVFVLFHENLIFKKHEDITVWKVSKYGVSLRI